MDYKDSLLMPQTDFSMRGNLPENEKLQRQQWEDMDLYSLLKEVNKEGKPFVLHDGPPYANGDIHIGHAMNKSLKDFINRYKFMMGYNVTYIPGWDTHGLPVEQAVTNSGINRKELSKAEFRKLCREYAEAQVAKQMDGFKAMNVIGDWDHPYITYQKEMEARQIEVFATMTKKGLIFRGLKPIYWSPSSESALAEAEIEYHDRKDPSIFVAFPVVEGSSKVEVGDNLVIWTTTPWTLPGNLGIAIGEAFKYARVKVLDKIYIVALDLLESLAQDFGWDNYEVVTELSFKDFEGVKYQHIFMDRISPVVPASHVTLDAGTGLVHTAPSYGADDFIVGQKYNLGMVNGINDQGVLTEESGMFQGLYFEDANKEVCKWLDENGYLLKLKFITHSYPHDWRTKKPIIFRATPQWFCSIDKIKDELLESIDEEINWLPSWGKIRLHNMIQDREDWCVSRQRVWGVPLPIFYNEDGSPILDYDVMMHVSDLFREYGSNVWFERDAKELLPEGYINPASPNGNFTKEEDTMDVWFDSGSTHTGVLVERGLCYPADVYLEGCDQYRGWFNSSLITGVSVYGKAPYKNVISHGFVLDGKGQKMSKSLGNVIDPLKVISERGSDVLRLWVASVDYTEDVPIDDNILKQVQESYRKIRNTYRFLLGNLFDFDPSVDKVSYEDMPSYDKYLMVKTNEFVKAVIDAYEEYTFQDVYKNVISFVSTTLSNFYLDFTKDILYTMKNDSLERRSVQTVLYEVLFALVRLCAPILPYTSEEVYKYMNMSKKESIFLEKMPEVKTFNEAEEILNKWNTFFMIKDDVYKALEEARVQKLIGKGLEASVMIHAEGEYLDVLNELYPYLKQLFIVSDVTLTKDILTDYNVVGASVTPFVGEKCLRCWNYYKEEEMEGEVCHRCHSVLSSQDN